MNPEEISYAIKVVEDYIYHRKNVVVKILFRVEDLGKLILGYNLAIEWFNLNCILLKPEAAQEG